MEEENVIKWCLILSVSVFEAGWSLHAYLTVDDRVLDVGSGQAIGIGIVGGRRSRLAFRSEPF